MAEEKKKTAARKRRAKKDDNEPLMASYGSASGVTSQRRNLSGVIERTDRWKNIDDGLIPFRSSKGYGKTTLSIRNAVILCQKCYYNFSIFRNIIDTMTEFSTSGIYFRGGSKKSREFFEALFNKIGLNEFQDKFFREYYRSGNVFTYRYDATLSEQDVKNITQIYGKQRLPKLPVEKMTIPSKYITLNPADIQLHGALNFSEGRYHKVLSDYELERVKNPKSDEDLEIYNSLDEKTKKLLKKGSVPTLFIPLNPDKLNAIFYHKQDYEPFAVPMGYPVLEDINFKYEMKKMDMALARTMQQAILLVTMGDEPEKGGVNQENLRKMQALFQNESIGRVLIADYTTKAEFVIPQIGALLDAKKYEVVDRDINIGLNNIFVGGEKFANQSAKVEVFIERLKCGREAFISQFLMPEIKRIARSLGFRSFPTPHFEDINLKTESETLRVYTRLIELGVLTAEEGVEAIGTHRLPTKEESIESQEEFKKLRDKGLYEPIAGGPETQKDLADRTHQGQMELQKENNKSQEKMGRENLKQGEQQGPTGKPSPPGVKKESGRPSGTKDAPYKSNRKVTPIGGKDGYSITKVKELFALSQDLETEVSKILRKKHKVKRLTNRQKEVSREISNIVMANEKSKDWLGKAQEYCDKPVDKNKERVNQINEVACLHEIDMEAASILYASKQKLEN
jgi:hypothetical protein